LTILIAHVLETGNGGTLFARTYDRPGKHLVLEGNIMPVPEGMAVVRPIMWHGKWYVIFQRIDHRGGGLTIALQEFDPSSLKPIGELHENKLPFSTDRKFDQWFKVPCYANADSSSLAFIISGLEDKKDQEVVLAMVFDEEFHQAWSRIISLPSRAGRLSTTDVEVDENGQVYMAFQKFGPTLNRKGIQLFQLAPQGGTEVEVRLANGNSPESVALCGSPGGMVVAGYAKHGGGNRDDGLTTFAGTVNPKTLQLEVTMESPLAIALGGGAAQVELLSRPDGGYHLVGLTTDANLGRAIHAQALSKDLESEWQSTIPRKQDIGQSYWVDVDKNGMLSVAFFETAKNIERLIAGKDLAATVQSDLLIRADFGPEGALKYARYGAWVNGSHNLRGVGPGEQVRCWPISGDLYDQNGPKELVYFRLQHGAPEAASK
jgi:hypothetical protein